MRSRLNSAPALLILAALVAGWLAMSAAPHPIPESDVSNRPSRIAGGGYVTSQACRSCHPQEYATWQRSYHRSMTAVASADSVVPDFDGVEIIASTGRYRLDRQGGDYVADLDDPDWTSGGSAPRIRRQVVLVTGSHHQQVFWYATGRGRLLGQFPLTYLVAEREWVPRRAAFMHPAVPRVVSETGHWNAVCIGCHTTNGRARLDKAPGTAPMDQIQADSRVSELGVACEACHGPGEAHVTANQNPARRYGLHLSRGQDSTISHPARMDPRRSAEVCGQCHSVWEWYDAQGERRENEQGVIYRPGAELRQSRFVAQPSRDLQSPTVQSLIADDPDFITDSFWPDGMVSVSGREYNGLIDSPCYVRGNPQRGTMTCLSCHAMHQPAHDARPVAEWADDQLKPGMHGNEACLQCHESIRPRVEQHTHHAAGSAGSSCLNCHMPYTTYGLLKGIRSHQVTSPDVATGIRTGRPNACSLCHLDRTSAWSAEQLTKWFQQSPPELSQDDKTIPASLLWLLRGDAQQRALAAYSFGWPAAQRTSGTAWMAQPLSVLLEDPYQAVRFIAARSLRTLPGYERFAYDFAAPAAERAMARAGAARVWDSQGAPAVLSQSVVARLLRERNDRRVFLRE